MKMNVINKELAVKNIRINEISTSSVFLIGDTKVITCSSVSDTPSESPAGAPEVPLPPETRSR
ncbi:hypothetical protein [Aneurinibacillus aneurinilyticus]|jgi:spore germination protein PD|uniref:Spore gernimation protein GerPD n=1 Tax=Aneurinibacillus aneurinilyticus TaxID=1391 RepID=A0A848CU20_ANEAE|nr:hypothetical protein [Aneurinibacillus aneurinilyticus]MCI1694870.1 spore gernimation protein GerPD [Aneurinibacillus aneurinilyticus]MED0672914.1 spore gernimation protein GerPD [Aneurinibacillus aneurinilyticus]MED0708966.1 spore gernimation protein GerPD [Aneurinibacillus aneurinilyticus]MED0723759.1 spore gernimation protein GerPD [Aneurinibacillus aneurinilyticus]MED0730334.1 spore gernimation protein GerPD [Aneurinibacillus aneurinilyticus]